MNSRGNGFEYRLRPNTRKELVKWQRSDDCGMDVCLAVLARHLRFGDVLSRWQIATVCGCTTDEIRAIEQQAFRKMRYAAMLLFAASASSEHGDDYGKALGVIQQLEEK